MLNVQNMLLFGCEKANIFAPYHIWAISQQMIYRWRSYYYILHAQWSNTKQVYLTTFLLPFEVLGWGGLNRLGKFVCSANFLFHANQKWMRSPCDKGHKPAFNLIFDSLSLCICLNVCHSKPEPHQWIFRLPFRVAFYAIFGKDTKMLSMLPELG